MLFTIQDYKEAFLFDDSFKTLSVAPDDPHEPLFSSGRTAVVFKVKDQKTNTYLALKCFLQLHDHTIERSKHISHFLSWVKSPYLVGYQLYEKEIWIQNDFYPVVAMEWVEGNTLARSLQKLCADKNKNKILDLALQFDNLALWLLSQNFAHGDLKSDNIIVTPQQNIVLVDYEGFFIPNLKNQKAYETGTEDYQHPLRTADHFDKYIDDVSILIISTALHSLALQPELWTKFHTGENMLFTHKSLKEIGNSPLFQSLRRLNSPLVNTRLTLLEYALSSKPAPIPGIAQALVFNPSHQFHNFYTQNKNKPQSGSIDPSFDIGTGFDNWVHTLAVLPDGRILAGGRFIQYNGKLCNDIACLHPDGRLDTAFDIGTGFDFKPNTKNIISFVNALAVLPDDGRILAGGHFIKYNGKPCNHIACLHPNGRLDTTFDTGTGFNDWVNTLAVLPDGRILVWGKFIQYNGERCNRIACLHPDGRLDTAFDTGTGFNDWVHTLATLPDGRILVGGKFSEYNRKPCNRIACLHPNGRLDTAFDTGTGFNYWVRTLAVLPDGRILVGGEFIEYNGKWCNRIACLHPDGRLDTTFDTGTGFDNSVKTLATLPDGRILAGGNFTQYNGKPCNRIACLHPDGRLDTAFDTGTGFNDSVETLATLPDGRILAGGGFREYNGKPCNRIACLYV